MTAERRAALVRAMDRSVAEGLVVYPQMDGTWRCKEYVLTLVGPQASAVTCSCPAGSHGTLCKHAVTLMSVRKYGARPVPLLEREEMDDALAAG